MNTRDGGITMAGESVSFVGGHTANSVAISRLYSTSTSAGASSALAQNVATAFNAPLVVKSTAPAPQQLTQQMTAPSSGAGIPRPVLIGGGILGVLAIGLVVFKLTR
jgi:hypothetical protein